MLCVTSVRNKSKKVGVSVWLIHFAAQQKIMQHLKQLYFNKLFFFIKSVGEAVRKQALFVRMCAHTDLLENSLIEFIEI